MDLTKAQFRYINMPYEHKNVFDCQYLGADTQSLTGRCLYEISDTQLQKQFECG